MRRIVALLIAVVCAVGAWACWQAGVRTTWYTPADETPGFWSTNYSGGWIVLSSLLCLAVGVAVLDVIQHIPKGGILKR